MYGTSLRGAAAYQQTSVQSSSPIQLIVLLYDGALRHLAASREAMIRSDAHGRRHGLSRALAIVAELQSTLNITDGGDIARSLDSLYAYVIERIIQANMGGDPKPLEEAERLLRPLRDAWSAIADGAPAAAPR